MNRYLILSMAWLSHGDIATAIDTWIGMAERVTLVREVRPALDMSLAFQVGSQSATVWTKGWSSAFFNLWTDKGMTR
jgi:hypothetical protein